MRGKNNMKKMTANYIVILFSALMMMTLLVQHVIRQHQAASVVSDHAFTQEDEAEPVSPDQITDKDLMRQITSREGETEDGSGNGDVSGTVGNMTTATTTVTKKSVTKTTTAVAGDADENGSYIIRQDYKSPYYIVVYTGSQSVAVYGKDSSGEYTRLVKAFICSTGRKDSSPTRKGMYKIRAKYRWRLLVGHVYGQYNSSISSSYLFHSVPYYGQNASTLENEEYDKLGSPASKGCIRMCVRDCKWIYDNCPIGTQVHVVWASGPRGDSVPQRNRDVRYSGWDPSDRWSKDNPYFAEGAADTSSAVTSATTVTETSATTTTVTTTAATETPTETTAPPETDTSETGNAA